MIITFKDKSYVEKNGDHITWAGDIANEARSIYWEAQREMKKKYGYEISFEEFFDSFINKEVSK